jgi:hypothetical protein
LAIQLPVADVRIRNAMFEELQGVGIEPTEPENWASPDELSGTELVVLITTFGPEGVTMQISVPMIEVMLLGTVPIELPPASTSPCT